MKVRCISDFISIENSPQSIINWANNSELEITLGKVYSVYAMSRHFDVIFYYILSDESNAYPLAFPHFLFEICDSDATQFWGMSIDNIKSLDTFYIEDGEVISFRDWSLKGDRFYENLLEGNREEVIAFEKFRDNIDNSVSR